MNMAQHLSFLVDTFCCVYTLQGKHIQYSICSLFCQTIYNHHNTNASSMCNYTLKWCRQMFILSSSAYVELLHSEVCTAASVRPDMFITSVSWLLNLYLLCYWTHVRQMIVWSICSQQWQMSKIITICTSLHLLLGKIKRIQIFPKNIWKNTMHWSKEFMLIYATTK